MLNGSLVKKGAQEVTAKHEEASPYGVNKALLVATTAQNMNLSLSSEVISLVLLVP